jgi:hypothetical protein
MASLLLVEEIGENLLQVTDKLDKKNVVSSTPHHEQDWSSQLEW